MNKNNLAESDLHIDQIYEGSRIGNASDDPLPSLLGVSSGAGFRHLGKRPSVSTLRLLILKTNFKDINWLDSLDRENGVFIYFGDNRNPGSLHDTPRQGNLILRNLYDEAHSKQTSDHFPPIFLFGSTGTYRDVRFLGLAVPGAFGFEADDDLIAVWRMTENGVRFQNYKAVFTVLDVPVIKREWIKDIQNGYGVDSAHAPEHWLKWAKGRKLTPLQSLPARSVRTKRQQLPESRELSSYIELIYSSFRKDPHTFENCAMQIAILFMPNINNWEMTRPWRDGGRDATGTYRIRRGTSSIDVEFAMEAKCYGLNSGVGVKALSRLISRLRHRQFGILVTTSYLDSQAYTELVQDGHPVVVISANDIAVKLKEKFGTLDRVEIWLSQI